LYLSYNELSGEGGEYLGRSLDNKKKLKTLGLNNCNLSGDALIAIAESLTENESLKELYMYSNHMNVVGA
jgi:Ran GTPase-activating protein (RanGAP) involved in mRNA processing and transport